MVHGHVHLLECLAKLFSKYTAYRVCTGREHRGRTELWRFQLLLPASDKAPSGGGLKFAGYADDCNIYVSSETAAKWAKENITEWLKRKLRLEVNESKSGTGRPWERKFLGFTIASSSLGKFKEKSGTMGSQTKQEQRRTRIIFHK